MRRSKGVNRSVRRNIKRSVRKNVKKNTKRNQRRVNRLSSRRRVSRRSNRKKINKKNRTNRRGNRKKNLTFSGGAPLLESEMISYLKEKYKEDSDIMGVNYQGNQTSVVPVFENKLNKSDEWIENLPKGPSTAESGEWLDDTKATHLILHNGTKWVCVCYGYSDNWNGGSGWNIYLEGKHETIDNYVKNLN